MPIRVRAGGVSGVFDVALTTTDTTISGAGVADLPAIVNGYYAPLSCFVIDGTTHRVTKRELMWVTAHAAGATTATVTRAQEGTTAQAWSIGDRFAVSVTPQDFVQNNDRRWVAGPAETSIDEFSDATLDASWVRVDSTAARVDWAEGADVLSAYNKGGDAASEVHAMMRPIGTAMAAGDAFVYCVTLHGPWTANYTMGGLVLADGVTYGAGNQLVNLFWLDTGGPPMTNLRAYTNYNAQTTDGANFRLPSATANYVRVVMTAADTWRADTSPDGVIWRIGASISRTLAPTYVGLMSSSWGTATTGIASYEFLRRVSGVS